MAHIPLGLVRYKNTYLTRRADKMTVRSIWSRREITGNGSQVLSDAAPWLALYLDIAERFGLQHILMSQVFAWILQSNHDAMQDNDEREIDQSYNISRGFPFSLGVN